MAGLGLSRAGRLSCSTGRNSKADAEEFSGGPHKLDTSKDFQGVYREKF